MASKIAQLKKHIDKGHLELARLDQNNQPIKMYPSPFTQHQTSQLNHQHQIYKLISSLSWQQKFEWVNTRRLKGNLAFKTSSPEKALQIYLESLIGLDLQNSDQDKIAQVKYDLQFPILMNMAACFYKLKLHQKGIQICDQVLNDPFGREYYQALYKKAYFLFQISSFEKAKYSFYHKAREIILQLNAKLEKNPSQKKVSKSDVKELFSKIISKTKEQKNMYRRIFYQDDDQLGNQAKSSQNEEYVLEYNENFIKRTVCWLKQAFESCYKTKSKEHHPKDQDQKRGLLRNKRK